MRKFEFVSRMIDNCENVLNENLKLPERSTKNSAGYDFFVPVHTVIGPKEIIYVRTGVKAYMEEGEMLVLCNRSSNPKKKHLVLVNGIGIVDADYADNPDNEGEIAFAFMNTSDEFVVLEVGDKLGQGIFMKYEIIDDDKAEGERTGGFGSTGK